MLTINYNLSNGLSFIMFAFDPSFHCQSGLETCLELVLSPKLH